MAPPTKKYLAPLPKEANRLYRTMVTLLRAKEKPDDVLRALADVLEQLHTEHRYSLGDARHNEILAVAIRRLRATADELAGLFAGRVDPKDFDTKGVITDEHRNCS